MELQDASPCAVLVTDRSGAILAHNAALSTLVGFSPQPSAGDHLDRLLPPASRIFMQTHVWPMLLREGQVQEVQLQITGAQQQPMPVLLNGSLADFDGQPACYWALFLARNRHRFEAELRAARSRAQADALALVQAQSKLQALYQRTPAMMHSATLDGLLLNVSDAWLARLGYQRDEVVGRPCLDFLTPAARQVVLDDVMPALLSVGHCQGVPLQVLAKQGEVIETLLSARLEHDANGRPDRSVAVLEDVTLRRHAERALALEHQRLLDLVDSSHAGTWEWQVQTGEIIVSPRWAQPLGWQCDELGPLTNAFRVELAHPDELLHTQALLRDHFAGRSEAYVAELRLRHRQGHWVWVEERGRVVSRSADGRPEWMFGILVDISERKRQQEALHRSEQWLQRTGEVTGVGAWQIDLADDSVIWSLQMRQLHSLPRDFQPTLASTFNFFAAEAQATLRAAYDAARSTGQGWDLTLPLLRADGQGLLVRSVGHAEVEHGRPVRLQGALQDVSEDVAQRRALRSAHERTTLAADSGGIGIWDLDLQRQALTVDAWVVRLYHLPAADTLHPDTLWGDALHADDRDATRQAVAQAIASRRMLELECRIVWADGSVHHLRLSARIKRDDHGQALALVGVCWDVTPLRELAAELAEQHELLRVTLQSIGDAVITTDDKGRVNWMNPVAERMTGWQSGQAHGLPLAQVFNILNQDTRQPAPNPVTACLAEGKIVGLANHTVLVARDGSEYGIEDSAAPIRNPQGRVLGVVLVFHDVSEQRRLSGEMTYRATHDALTGLINRSEFDNRLLRVLRNAQEDGREHALLFIDLDQFKRVNDACGHAIGDQLLRQMAKLLGAAVRARDTLARLGGDEFAIILEHCTLDQARVVAQKICDQMDDFRFIHDDRRFRIGTSIGLVPLDRRWTSTSALQQAADTACYAAKEAGRNRVHVWFDSDAQMQARQAELQWTTRIERALDDGAFQLHAQRILPLSDTRPGLHAEVLLRLSNPDGSLTAPGAFLPAAERFHLITRIDRWVLDQVLGWMQGLADLSRINTLSVNLSGRSVGDRAFHAWALERLAAAGPAVCARLCLEITETAAVTHLADAMAFITQVRSRQVRVALDDFGAGASSFGYLKTLPVDQIKIDGQFVRDLVNDPLDAAAVRCFADVARVLVVQSVAEFVESPEVLARVREIGIDFAQGFLLHRPEALDCLLQDRLLGPPGPGQLPPDGLLAEAAPALPA